MLAEPSVIRSDFDRIAGVEASPWDANAHYHPLLLDAVPKRCPTALDVGCGTGAFTRLLAERADHVLGLDLSPEMVRVAQERSRAQSNVVYRVADVMQVDLPVASFDCIVSIATLHHLTMEAVLEKLVGALKPGGRLIVLDLFEPRGLVGLLQSTVALVAKRAAGLLQTGRLSEAPEVRAAWAAHARHDVYLTLAEVRHVCAAAVPGAVVKRHLFWRYSLTWTRPAND